MEPSESKPGIQKIVGVVALLVVGVAAFFLSKTKSEGEVLPPTKTSNQNTAPNENATAETEESVTVYKNGTYTTEGTYTSPAGEEKISIQMTLTNDVITATSFTGLATNPASVNWQKKFSEGYISQVVGKPISTLSLGVTNGSSLTPKGFMQAVEKIKTLAQNK